MDEHGIIVRNKAILVVKGLKKLTMMKLMHLLQGSKLLDYYLLILVLMVLSCFKWM